MTAVQCVLCLTTGGNYMANVHRPARIDLAKYGIDGKACAYCYQTVRYRVAHNLDPMTGDRKR
jgi:hypothetical protein